MIHQPVSVVSECSVNAWLVAAWLSDLSANLREAVAHYRRVRDDALHKSTVYLHNLNIKVAPIMLLRNMDPVHCAL